MERPVLIRVGAGNGDTGERDLPSGSGRAEGRGAVGSVQICDKGGNERRVRQVKPHDSAVSVAQRKLFGPLCHRFGHNARATGG